MQNALDLAAKIGVAGGINDVDAVSVPINGRAFGQNGDAALFFQIAFVHGPFHHSLVGAKGSTLTQNRIHQGCFSMVNVGNNGNVAQASVLRHKKNPKGL